ncbi:MAG: malate synthase A [Deltaproteobacteria bacterium]|nr:malate synthase A [Deltaproteobacteria bacterium]MBW2070696.1 malate synthase A [Deltaproteobacteria bacterium]
MADTAIHGKGSDGVEILGQVTPEFAEILTPEALAFVARLHREFDDRRLELLQEREERQAELDAGSMPDFLEHTREIKEGNWQVAPIPDDLQDRRVEITGPAERKMIINALNSGASVFMADFEDANSPTWYNMVQGQVNLRDAVAGTISFSSPKKEYRLNEETATLLVRPRGWHLPEKHVLVNGRPVSGSLFDFGLFFFHNARRQIDNGTGPYFYIAKLENHLESRLWNDVFCLAQDELGIPRGTIRATVLLETILAAFEMEEILFEMRDHSAGLNLGRWDYIFSFIKRFRKYPDFVMPDRSLVTMASHFLHSASLLLIQTCHKRGAHAMGGMMAQIPVKGDQAANEAALAKVLEDKEREAGDGHDGTWVAHPGLVQIAKKTFDKIMPEPNQIHRKRHDVHITAEDLLTVPEGAITENGIRHNINVGLQYLEAWLRGIGCVPIYNLMEDAATAEISRTQVWQWIHHPTGVLTDGREVTNDLYRQLVPEELAKIREMIGSERFSSGKFDLASELFDRLITEPDLHEWLTLTAYDYLD